jgi:2-iminobutanoate/2-iminopropanoate deaminase
VYVTDIGLWGQVNAVYADFFGAHKPARTVVPVPGLHHGYLIEMDVIAAVN